MSTKTDMLAVEVFAERIDITADDRIVASSAPGRSRQRVPVTESPLPDPPANGSISNPADCRWACRR